MPRGATRLPRRPSPIASTFISALLRRWQRSTTGRRVVVERLRRANFCLNIGPAQEWRYHRGTTGSKGRPRTSAEVNER
jgi:hypothetical protein